MNASEVFCRSTGLWKYDSQGMMVVMVSGIKRFVFNRPTAEVWHQIDGVKTVGEIIEAIQEGSNQRDTGVLRNQVMGILEQLQQYELVYRIGRVWADGLSRLSRGF